jgi:L-threonylcarbamoyladenylate synthase
VPFTEWLILLIKKTRSILLANRYFDQASPYGSDRHDMNGQTQCIRPADTAALRDAADLLLAGKLVAFPTETVYGLGANALNGEAVAGIFAAKKRPKFNPLIVHVADLSQARSFGNFNNHAVELARAFWPGPITLVVPKSKTCKVCDIAMAGLNTIALRIPGGLIAQELLRVAGIPIAAPSANRSGHISATVACHVAADLGMRVSMVLDDGPTVIGIESTIISCQDDAPRLLRAGAIERSQIEKVIGQDLLTNNTTRISAPGQLTSHYAPNAILRINATQRQKDDVFIAFGTPPLGSAPEFNLSPSGDIIEAAANLFSVLRQIDLSGAQNAAIMPIPHHGIGEAINDRLNRASAQRA